MIQVHYGDKLASNSLDYGTAFTELYDTHEMCF
jgi:hypothetical protein